MDFIANGEIAVVRRVRRTRELYGFRFAEVVLSFPDYNDFEIEANLLLDTLHSDAPALPKTENDRLFYSVLEDYADITVKRERMKKMKADPHYNALQVKYAYAVTCHKAQGGQWQNVFLDQGYMSDEYLTPDYFRWLYTAFTRASKTLNMVNYPKEHVESFGLSGLIKSGNEERCLTWVQTFCGFWMKPFFLISCFLYLSQNSLLWIHLFLY